MRIVIFCHSLVSCWNHGNAHFLRGVVRELARRGHDVKVHEPEDGWSRAQLVREQGAQAVAEFERAFPDLQSSTYADSAPDLEQRLDGADLVLVHEWNDPSLVGRIGAYRRRQRSFRLLFHDTHHRSVTAPSEMEKFDLRDYDGVLAFGDVVRALYLERGWAERAWTFHEAADTTVFRPLAPERDERKDLVWVGNWGDDERAGELGEFLFGPIADLDLTGTIHGVRYPGAVLERLSRTRVEFAGFLPNHRVPAAFAGHRVTVHVPRGPYVRALPGIPTIRPFEALACRLPLVSSPWSDVEGLFRPGVDFLVARSGEEMSRHLRALLADEALRSEIAESGHRRVLERHTCAHRVDQLFEILAQLGERRVAPSSAAPAREVL